MLCVSAPGAPTKVLVTSNVTDAIIVQWTSPQVVFRRVDRYYIQYQAVGEPHNDEIIISDVGDSYDIQQVNLLSILFIN